MESVSGTAAGLDSIAHRGKSNPEMAPQIGELANSRIGASGNQAIREFPTSPVHEAVTLPIRPLLVLSFLLLAGALDARAQEAARISQSPVGTMSELMIKVIYPASDAIFYITTRTPSSDAEWTVLQGQALMVAESANLLMMPAHMRDESRWLSDALLMRDAGRAAFKAAKDKDVKALENLNEKLYQSCVTCHQHYRPNYGRR
jgi:hypothetical protein